MVCDYAPPVNMQIILVFEAPFGASFDYKRPTWRVIKKITLKRWVFCLFVGLMVLVGLAACLILWRGSTKDIEAVASLLPLDGWQQTSYVITPTAILVFFRRLSEISKAWTTPNQITRRILKSLSETFLQVNANHSRCMDYEDNRTLDLCEYIGERGGLSVWCDDWL